MQVIRNLKVAFVDVDSTLVMWDLSKYPELEEIEVMHNDRHVPIKVNRKNLNFIFRLNKQGFSIIVWSKAGFDWAESVVRSLGITHLVEAVMSKPSIYIDDTEANEWMPERFYRSPNADNSERGKSDEGQEN